jgi:hypothetical protein
MVFCLFELTKLKNHAGEFIARFWSGVSIVPSSPTLATPLNEVAAFTMATAVMATVRFRFVGLIVSSN